MIININYQDAARPGWLNKGLVFDELVIKIKTFKKCCLHVKCCALPAPLCCVFQEDDWISAKQFS